MTPKLLAFLGAVLVCGVVPYYQVSNYRRDQPPQPPTETLVPPRVGDFQAIERWKLPPNKLDGTEQGALYARTGSDQKVQFDLFVGNLRPHDGLGCYLVQGARIVKRHPEKVRTLDDNAALFDISIVESNSMLDPGIKLIATTACGATQCQPESTFGERLQVSDVNLMHLLRPKPVALPMSITLNADADLKYEPQMREAMVSFLSKLALDPYKTLSRLPSE